MRLIGVVLASVLLICSPSFAAYGDVDHSGSVDLKDAVLALQATAGMNPEFFPMRV